MHACLYVFMYVCMQTYNSASNIRRKCTPKYELKYSNNIFPLTEISTYKTRQGYSLFK